MKLSRSQKKYIKKNLKKLCFSEIAQNLGINEDRLKLYLRSIWSKEKYNKFFYKKEKLKDQKKQRTKPAFDARIFIFLFFLTFIIYFNSFTNDFVSDDIAAIVQNENIGNLFYYFRHQPLNFLRYFFYFIAYKVGGMEPLFFRFFNFLFHFGSVIVIYLLTLLLYSPFLAVVTASWFAVHPILSETVVWISGGVHSQYSFFILLSFLLYILAKSENRFKKYYFFSLISFLLALITTEKAAILPLIILFYELSFNKLSKVFIKIIPYFLLSSIWVVIVFSGGFFNKRLAALQSSYYQEAGLYNPLIQIPVAVGSYLRLIFWPDKLTIYHSELVYSKLQFVVMVIITLSFFGALIYTFFNKKYRDYFFWLSFFIVSLLPMLTPFKVGWVVAERYVYLGALGIFVVLGFGFERLYKMIGNKKIIYLIISVILISLSARTVRRNVDWKNQDNLWLAAAKISPSSPQNNNNLGDLYGRQKDYEKAIYHFQKAIELKPGYADAYHNLANTYGQIGEIELAMENYKKAIEFNPKLWQSYQNLAAIYFELNDKDKAKEFLQKALEINPSNQQLQQILSSF